MNTSFNRRRLLTVTAAAGGMTVMGGGLTPSLLRAQTSDVSDAAQSANAATYRFGIGDIRATVISDGTIAGNIRIYASDAPQPDLDAILGAANLPQDQFVLQLNATLLEIGDQKIIVDPGANLALGPNGGQLLGRLAALGINPADIDAVIITHAHPDHVGNLRMADGTPTFPNAAVYLPAPDWQFFVVNEPDLTHLPMPAEFRERFIMNIRTSLQAVADNVVEYTPGREIMPRIMAIPAFGHTPGMSALLIASGNDQLLVTADIAYHPLLNIDNRWRPGVDLDAEAAKQTRDRLFDMASADRLLMLGFHFPFPGMGRLLRSNDRYTWMPQAWNFNA